MADRAIGIPFAKEGIPFIGVAVGVTLLAGWLGWVIVAVGAALLTLFVSWFFRNPSRVVPMGPRLVLAPGDGKVIAIEEEFEPRFIKDRSIRLTIFLNVSIRDPNRISPNRSPHTARSPGEIQQTIRLAINPATCTHNTFAPSTVRIIKAFCSFLNVASGLLATRNKPG